VVVSYDIKKRAERLAFVINESLLFGELKDEQLKLIEDNLNLAYEEGKLVGILESKELIYDFKEL